MSENNLQDQDVSEIDKALALAKARKEAKKGLSTDGAEKPTKAAKEPKVPSEPKRTKVTEEEKAARLAKREAERAERKAERDAARQAKQAERTAGKAPAHMRKVQKAAEKLSDLGQAAQLLLNEATTNLTAAELAALALHIQHFNRVKATERALDQKIEAGTTVQIVSGDPRFIGKVGTVVKAQRIRCYVNIQGANNRPVPGTNDSGIYFFTSDVSPATVEVEQVSESATA